MKIKGFQRKFNQAADSFGLAVEVSAFFLIVSLTILFPPANSAAKDWPTKSITIIVPWTAGAGTDIAARTLAPKLSRILGVSVQVVNKPGGGGIIGTLEAVKSPPDGYTLLSEIAATSSIQHALAKDLPYKVEKRTYIARAISTPLALAVPASSPWKTVEDLVNAIRTDPSSISFGLVGGSGVPDMAIYQFRAAMVAKGVDVSKTRAVIYKGTGEVNPAIAGGHLSFTFASPSGVNAFISAGKIRVLGMSVPERYKGWPDVPTMAEAGYPTVNMVLWVGLSGPPGLPTNIVKTMDDAVRETLKDPDIAAKLDSMGIIPFYLSTDKFRRFVLDEGEAIKALKLK